MSRVVIFAILLLMVAGCVAEERTPLRLLPEDMTPRPYRDMLGRAQKQVGVATEAYYSDEWFDLEDAGRALEQTARFLPKATETPPRLQKTLPALAVDLGREANQLREAARAKDARKTHETLQALLVKIRALRPEP
jgi:hypothetical protein